MKKELKNLAGAAIAASVTGCVLPDYAQELTPEDQEKVGHSIKDAAGLMLGAESLLKSADPLFDAHGEPVEDNEVLIYDLYQTLGDLQYYNEHGQIYTYSGKEDKVHQEDAAFFRDPVTEEENLDNDYILLNRDDPDWDAAKLMHEAGHRTHNHNDEYLEFFYSYIGPTGGLKYDREQAKMIIKYRDYTTLNSFLFTSLQKTQYGLAAFESYRKIFEDHDTEPSRITELWHVVQSMYETETNQSIDSWNVTVMEQVLREYDLNMDVEGFYDELGVDRSELEQAFRNEAMFKYRQKQIKEHYRAMSKIYKEAIAELGQERKAEFNEPGPKKRI